MLVQSKECEDPNELDRHWNEDPNDPFQVGRGDVAAQSFTVDVEQMESNGSQRWSTAMSGKWDSHRACQGQWAEEQEAKFKEAASNALSPADRTMELLADWAMPRLGTSLEQGNEPAASMESPASRMEIHPSQPLELVTPSHPMYQTLTKGAPFLVVEVPMSEMPPDDDSREKIGQEGHAKSGGKGQPKSAVPKTQVPSRLDFNRWLTTVFMVIVVQTSGARAYMARQFRTCLHYEIPASDLDDAVKKAERVKKKRSDFEFVVLDTNQDGKAETHGFFKVLHDLDPATLSLFPLWDMLEAVSKRLTDDKKREQPCINLGVCGNNNSTREPRKDGSLDNAGIAYPRFFEGTMSLPWVAPLFLACTNFVFTHFGDFAPSAYRDHNRNKFFARAIAGLGNFFEAVLLAGRVIWRGGNKDADGGWARDALLAPHMDTQNEHKDPRCAWVFGVTFYLFNPLHNCLLSVKIIGYGKAAVGDFMRRYLKFSPHIASIKNFHNNILPSGLKVVDTSLLKGDEWKTLRGCHTNKQVHYSVLAQGIRMAHLANPWMTLWHVLAMLHCSLVSNKPRVFREVMDQIAGGMKAQGPIAFHQWLYDDLWEKRKKENSSHCCQRRLPSHNKKATGGQLLNSILALARIILEANSIPADELAANVGYFYSRLVAHLSQATPQEPADITCPQLSCGVIACGSLTAQELIGVAAILGLIPMWFAAHASIGHTTLTFQFLVNELDPPAFTAENFTVEQQQLLLAVASALLLTLVGAEELICQWKRWHTRTLTQFKDSIPPGLVVTLMENVEGAMTLVDVCPDGTRHPTTPLMEATVLKAALSNLELEGKTILQDNKFWSKQFPGWTKLTFKKKARKQKSRPTIRSCLPIHECPLSETQQTLRVPVVARESIVRTDLVHKTNKIDVDILMKLVLRGSAEGIKNFDVYEYKELDLSLSDGQKSRWVKRNGKRKGGKMFAVGVKAHGSIHYPPSTFELHDFRSPTHVVDDRRYFDECEVAREYACLWMLVSDPLLYVTSPLVRNLLQPAETMESVWEEWAPMVKGFPKFDDIRSYQIMRNSKRRSIPWIVKVDYLQGGLGIYMVDDIGVPVSAIHVILPLPIAERTLNGTTARVGIKGIVRHRGRGANTKLVVAWEDGLTSTETLEHVASQSRYTVLDYGAKHNLTQREGWKQACRCGETSEDTTTLEAWERGSLASRSEQIFQQHKLAKELLELM